MMCLFIMIFIHSNSCYRSFPLPNMAKKNRESCYAHTAKSYHTLSLLTSRLTHNAVSALQMNGLSPLGFCMHIAQNGNEFNTRIISRELIIRGINHFLTTGENEEQILLQSKKFGWKSQYLIWINWSFNNQKIKDDKPLIINPTTMKVCVITTEKCNRTKSRKGRYFKGSW